MEWVCNSVVLVTKSATNLIAQPPVPDSLVNLLLWSRADPKYPHLLFSELLEEFIKLLEVALCVYKADGILEVAF